MEKKAILNRFNLSVLIFLISFIVIFNNLQNISKLYFDEFHYIPAAKQWLNWAPNNNLEHPPLGKMLIATSIKMLGDNPIGWRAGSAIAGSVSISLCFLIAMLIFDDLLISCYISSFTLFNFWIYVQSRIGMLDIFMVCFLLGAIYNYLEYQLKLENKYFYLMGIFWGLAVAIKWSAIYIYLPFFMLTIIHDFNRAKAIKYIKVGILSVLIYFLTYIPYTISNGSLHYNLIEIFTKIPFEMLNLQKQVPSTHPYRSSFYSWPFMSRPIWYGYINNLEKGYFQGIVLLGNPIQMFLGFICVCILILKNNRSKKIVQATLILFLNSWLMWAVVPRQLTLFYYFFPSAMFYSFLIPMTLNEFFNPKITRLIMGIITLLSIGLFAYFYPILSGSFVREGELSKWMWMSSWI